MSNSYKEYASKEYVKEEILNSVADWNQTDVTSLDYIKNKPDETDALNLVMEEGFVEPLADVDGTIYTTPDGNIYTLD